MRLRKAIEIARSAFASKDQIIGELAKRPRRERLRFLDYEWQMVRIAGAVTWRQLWGRIGAIDLLAVLAAIAVWWYTGQFDQQERALFILAGVLIPLVFAFNLAASPFRLFCLSRERYANELEELKGSEGKPNLVWEWESNDIPEKHRLYLNVSNNGASGNFTCTGKIIGTKGCSWRKSPFTAKWDNSTTAIMTIPRGHSGRLVIGGNVGNWMLAIFELSNGREMAFCNPRYAPGVSSEVNPQLTIQLTISDVALENPDTRTVRLYVDNSNRLAAKEPNV